VAAAAHSWLALSPPAPHLPARARASRRGVLYSALLHAAIALFALTLAGRVSTDAPSTEATRQTSSRGERILLPRIVLLPVPGPGGGGGGGGNRQPRPPSRARGQGSDPLTLPVAAPIVAAERPADAPQPPQQLVIDAVPMAEGTAVVPGVPDGDPSAPFSQGPGSGGGVGDGRGTGLGSGTGPGIGPGSGGGVGGGAYRVGNGVTSPALLSQTMPKYTAYALERKIQGTVTLEVTVGRDGAPGAIRVVRSLEPGLDREAIAAVSLWRFSPGRLGNEPVDVLVTVVVDFRIT
jgi:TonB family protein